MPYISPSGQFNLTDFDTPPSDQLPPLAMYLLQFIHDHWQPQTLVMQWTAASMARAIGIPAQAFQRLLAPKTLCSLETATKVYAYFAEFGMSYESLLLALLGYYPKHPQTISLLEDMGAVGSYLAALLAWVDTPQWQEAGGYFQDQGRSWLLRCHTSRVPLEVTLHHFAAFVRCWLDLGYEGRITDAQWTSWASTLRPPSA